MVRSQSDCHLCNKPSNEGTHGSTGIPGRLERACFDPRDCQEMPKYVCEHPDGSVTLTCKNDHPQVVKPGG